MADRTDLPILIPAAGLLLAALLLGSCGQGPRREKVDGVVHVRNPSTPAAGETFPDPRVPVGLQMVTAGVDGAPAWSAVREVRAWPAGGWAVLDIHRAEIAVLDEQGHTDTLLDLSEPPIDLVSPVTFTASDSVTAVADMALRRVVRLTLDGEVLARFEVGGGLPSDVAGGPEGGYHLLTVARPFAGKEQITQVRRYGPEGEPRQVAGEDSLLLEHRSFADLVHPLPLTLDAAPDGTLYAAALAYRVHQVLPDGTHSVFLRPSLVTRVPDPVLEQRRALMGQRIPSQRRAVPVTEETEIVRLLAAEDGSVLVQTTDWHPALLDDDFARSHHVLLLDRFESDGTWTGREAVQLPLPAAQISLTDLSGGWVYGWAVPSSGEGSISVFRFRLEKMP